MSSTCPFRGTTADENELGCYRRGRMSSSALVELKSPRMSLALDAVENNGLSPSLRRGAREGDFRDCASLRRTAEGDSHGSFVFRVLWAGCAQVLHHCLCFASA